MRKIEFYAHTLLIAVLLVLLIFAGREALIIVLIAQFFLGVYQIIISIITTLNINAYSEKTRRMVYFYWAFCIFYLVDLVIVLTVHYFEAYTYHYLIAAWAIALYYYFISYHMAYPNYTKSHLDI